jgi:cystathionine beta-lyase/cystathionine gamma-synthase
MDDRLLPPDRIVEPLPARERPLRRLHTELAQIGVGSDPGTGSVSTPIYQNATFQHPGLGRSTGYDYSRSGNPTRAALEQGLARLEGGHRGFAFSTGMAAVHAVLSLLSPGDHLVVTEDPYGGSYRLLETLFGKYGLTWTYVDTADTAAVAAAIGPQTRMLFVETPTNPMMRVADLIALGALANQRGVLLAVDNTFLSPYLQRPIAFGAHLVVHSASKYLAGHNDVVAGAVVTANAELSQRIAFYQNAIGAVLGPQDCWLVMRGIKTLGLRMERAQQNALALAEFLREHPAVDRVYYPGLPDHPGHETLRRQAAGPGAMLSFALKDAARVPRLLERVQVALFAESLGGVETLITYPATQTHADVPQALRDRLGITDRLLRLSVGIEDIEDLKADFAQALA